MPLPSSVPAQMRVVEISEPGGPQVLKPAMREVEEPRTGEVLIAVSFAGVNRPDCLQRLGAYPPPKDASDLPGLEVSGTIAAIGPDCSRFEIGDEVIALTSGGGYAQYVRAAEGTTMAKPKRLGMVEAAGIPETYMTVWHNVFQRGQLKKGETILIHGGSSGIGSTAIQLASNFGARVIITAGSADKCKWCEELGADHAINYREEDFVDAVSTLTDGRGTDVILDMVGGSYIQRNINAAAPDGRIVQIAFLEGPKAEVNFVTFMTKRLTLTGSTLRPRTPEFKAALARELEEIVFPLIEAGVVAPQISKVFDLDEAAQAHALMESGDLVGKVMLRI